MATMFELEMGLDPDEFVSGAQRAKRAARGLGSEADRAGKSADGMGSVLKGQLGVFTAVAGSLLSVSGAVSQAAASFQIFRQTEIDLVGVGKTTGIVGAELQSLLLDVTDLATKGVPVLTGQLLELGQAAGQVGVQGSENILRYIETFGKLGAASDLHGEDAVKTLTRLMNVQGEGPENVERMASVLVRLGNNAAASESEIARHTSEVGRATAMFKIGSTQALAYGASLAEIGSRAEGGGTAIGRTMREIQKAVSGGGEDLTSFARIAQMSADEFSAAWKGDPVEALNDLLRGLSRFGTDMGVALEEVGLGGDEIAKVIPVLAENFNILAKNQSLAADESIRITALSKEAEVAFGTADAAIQRFSNALDANRRILGEEMAPAIVEVVERATDFISQNPEMARQIGQVLGNAVRVATSALQAFLEQWDLIKIALETLPGAGIAKSFMGIARSATESQKAIDDATKSTRDHWKEWQRVESTIASGSLDDVSTALVEHQDRLAAIRTEYEDLQIEVERYERIAKENKRTAESVSRALGNQEGHYREIKSRLGELLAEEKNLTKQERELYEAQLDLIESSEDLSGGLEDVGDKAEDAAESILTLEEAIKGQLDAARDAATRARAEGAISMAQFFGIDPEGLSEEQIAQIERDFQVLQSHISSIVQGMDFDGIDVDLPPIDPEVFLPTEQDLRRMTRERAREMREEWERELEDNPLLDMADAAFEIADALDPVDQSLADIAETAGILLETMTQIGQEGGKINAAVAGAQFAEAVGNAITDGNNYGAEGGAVGAVVGAIIGAFFSAPAQGAAIGGAAGSAIGSFINKGVDEFLGAVGQRADEEVEGVARTIEGDMGAIGLRFVDAIDRGIEAAIDLMGASGIDFGGLEVKIRDGVFSIFHDGVVARFESMQEAVDFAIMSALKSADFEGISDEVRTALENSTADSFAALAEDLDFARMVEKLPEVGEDFSQASLAVNDVIDWYTSASRKAKRLGIDLDKLDQEMVRRLDSIRDSILGISETEEERIRREAEAFNREVKLLEAEQKLRKADLEGRRAEILAKAGTIEAFGGIQHQLLLLQSQEIDAKVAHLKATGMLVEGEVELARRHLEAIGAINAAIAATGAILEGLPSLISEGDIQAAINRIPSGSGAVGGASGVQQRQERRAEIRAEMSALEDLLVNGPKPDALQAWDEVQQTIEDLTEEMQSLSTFTQEEIDRMAELQRLTFIEDLVRGAQDVIDAAGLSDVERQVQAINDRYEAEIEAAKAAGATADQIAILSEARQEEIDAIKDSILAEAQAVVDAAGRTDLQNQIAGINEHYDALIADAEAAGATAEEIALLNAAREDEVDVLREQHQEQVDALGQTTFMTGEFTTQLGDLREQVADLMQNASDLGMSLEDVIQAGAMATQQLGFDFLNSLTSISGFEMPPEIAERLLEMQRAMILMDLASLAAAGAFEFLNGELPEIPRTVEELMEGHASAAFSGAQLVGEQLLAGFFSAFEGMGNLTDILGEMGSGVPASGPPASAGGPPASAGGPASGDSGSGSSILQDLLDAINSAFDDLIAGVGQAGSSVGVGSGSSGPTLNEQRDFLEEFIRRWAGANEGQFMQQAMSVEQEIADLLDQLSPIIAQSAEAQNAIQMARQATIDDILGSTGGPGDLRDEYEELVSGFDDARAALELLGASAEELARLEEDRADALGRFFEDANSGLQSILDSFGPGGEHSQLGGREQIDSLFSELQSTAAQLQNDPFNEALRDRVEQLANQLLGVTGDFGGSGPLMANLVSYLENVLPGLMLGPDDLGDGGVIPGDGDEPSDILGALESDQVFFSMEGLLRDIRDELVGVRETGEMQVGYLERSEEHLGGISEHSGEQLRIGKKQAEATNLAAARAARASRVN